MGISTFLRMEELEYLVLNADETNFQMSPKSGKVLEIKGWKNIYEVVLGNEKETITALCTFNANGDIIKGMIVYPYKKTTT